MLVFVISSLEGSTPGSSGDADTGLILYDLLHSDAPSDGAVYALLLVRNNVLHANRCVSFILSQLLACLLGEQ